MANRVSLNLRFLGRRSDRRALIEEQLIATRQSLENLQLSDCICQCQTGWAEIFHTVAETTSRGICAFVYIQLEISNESRNDLGWLKIQLLPRERTIDLTVEKHFILFSFWEYLANDLGLTMNFYTFFWEGVLRM